MIFTYSDSNYNYIGEFRFYPHAMGYNKTFYLKVINNKTNKMTHIDEMEIVENSIKWSSYHIRQDNPLIAKQAVSYFEKIMKNLIFA